MKKLLFILAGCMILTISGCGAGGGQKAAGGPEAAGNVENTINNMSTDNMNTGNMSTMDNTDKGGLEADPASGKAADKQESSLRVHTASQMERSQEIYLEEDWQYAEFSKISTGAAILYYSGAADRKGITVCVNAGHGTKGGSSVKTQCHPNGTAKVTGGSTGAGSYTAAAVSSGMTFADGVPEPEVTLAMAKKLKSVLLEKGYDVLMIRENDDVQLDNIARTVIANHCADCHIALHWDSTENDKGAFYMGVPDIASYRSMEPVASHWEQHEQLGSCLIEGLRGSNIKIFSEGRMGMDLTQTSYSTVPSVDIELGDKVSDHSEEWLAKLAEGLAEGIDLFFTK